MPLDFNTLEPQTSLDSQKVSLEPQKSRKFGESPEGENRLGKYNSPSLTNLLLFSSLILSVFALVLSTYVINNLPSPEPVTILCDPGLQDKIEKEVHLLQEIASSSKSKAKK